MLVRPSKMKLNMLLRNRTINFETNKKNYYNLVIVGTDDKESLYKVINSKLFRPQQMQAVFTPRVIKPMGRMPIRYDIGELYTKIKDNTNGRIIYCKMNPTLYSGRNVIYDMTNEYSETAKLAKKIKPGKPGIDYIRNYESELYNKIYNEFAYDKNYLVLPFDKFIPDLRANIVRASSDDTHPITLFLKDYREGNLKEKYGYLDNIIFFNPNADVIVAIDPNSEDLPEFNEIFIKLNRLNDFNDANSEENLEDGVENSEEYSDADDYEESLKDQLKEVVFKKVAKELKAKNLTDFESSTKEEKEIILAIDKKIDNYLSTPENTQRPFADLVAEVETDNYIKSKAIKYVETKRLAQVKAVNMSKNLTQEVEAIDKVSDIVGDENFEPVKFNTKYPLDPRIQESALAAMDKEYTSKFMRKDLNDAFSAFSDASYLPTAVQSIEYEDTSDDFNEKETAHVRYKTDENQTLTFTIDIPKIVDDHYIYVNGTRFTIPKQLLRLPIVKTKSSRVEITTSYQKMTIERSGSKVSRKNAYLLKILKEYDNPNVEIVYGDNLLINNKYDNDFEYEEISQTIATIKNRNITLNFNRDNAEEHAYACGIPEDFFEGTLTPIGYNEEDEIYYIDDSEIKSAKYDQDDDKVVIQKVSESLYDFITKDVLELKSRQNITIGKAFIYSIVKFLTVKFPVFVIVGLMNGLTNVLERHHTKYKVSETKLDLGRDYVEVKFKNKYLYYEDKIENTMLLNILYGMNTEDYDIEDFDSDLPFMDYLVDKMGQPMYVKQTLMINLDKMIDPISRAVLKDMKLPTNIYDLLLLANNMLINNKYQPLNDLTNYRIRGNEVIAAALYETLAMAQKSYEQHKMNGNAKNITIKRNELISKLIGQRNINPTSFLNPILELEDAFQCSAKGLKGVNLGKKSSLNNESNCLLI